MYFHFTHLYVSINFWILQIYLQPFLYSPPFFSVRMFLFWYWCVCVSAEPWTLISWGLSAAVSQRIGPHSALSGGACTERLLDAKWTGNFSSLDAAPENSSFFVFNSYIPTNDVWSTNKFVWVINKQLHSRLRNIFWFQKLVMAHSLWAVQALWLC